MSRLLCMLLLLCLTPLGAAAQTAEEPAPEATATPEEETPAFAETLIVTATLKEEEEERIPASVSVIDKEEIQARQATTVAEVLSAVPGVAVAQSGSAGHVTSVFTRGTDSNQTLVLWNGIPLNEPILGGFDWAFLPTDGVERVEVVRGPFSALYGSNAIGGVVQVFTGGGQGTSLRLEGGEDGYLRGGVTAGYDLGATRLDVLGHVRRGDGEFANDFYDSEELAARAQWAVTAGGSLGLLVRFNDSDVGIPFSGSRATPFRRTAWREQELAVPFNLTRGPWRVNALLSGVSTELAFRDPGSSFSRSDIDWEVLRGRVVTSYDVREGSWLACGAEWQRQQASNASNFGVSLDDDSQTDAAVLGQGHYEAGKAQIDLGLRAEDNEFFGSHWSPKAGVVWLLSEALRLHASYGEGFRAPSLGELLFPFSGNPDLEPETSRSYEAGLDYDLGRWGLGLAGFHNRLRNQIDFDFVAARNVNIGNVRTRGVEAEVHYRTAAVRVRLNGTYLDTEDLGTGLELLRRPQRNANLLVTLRPAAAFTLNLVGRYVGERPDIHPDFFTRVTNPSYTRLDVAAQWQALPWLAPYARVENAADEDYAEVVGFPAPGRRLIGGVGVTF